MITEFKYILIKEDCLHILRPIEYTYIDLSYQSVFLNQTSKKFKNRFLCIPWCVLKTCSWYGVITGYIHEDTLNINELTVFINILYIFILMFEM